MRFQQNSVHGSPLCQQESSTTPSAPLRSLASRVLLYEKLFTETECRELVEQAEAVGLSQQKYADFSHSKPRARTGFEEPSWGDALWHRLLDKIPPLESLYANNFTPHPLPECPLNEFIPVGINPFLRVYKYQPGSRFSPHEDSAYIAPNGTRSFLTVLLYLNEGFAGGETIFYADQRSPEEGTIACSPKTGTIVIFPHELWHEGAVVVRGDKYALRTEVMYARSSKGVFLPVSS